MTEFLVTEAKPHHCGAILRRLRIGHREALDRTGVNAHREMRALFDTSSFRRAWFIDGELAAIGGVSGTALSSYGFVWVALSETATKYPVHLVKEARRQMAEIMVMRRELATTIIGGDDAARRFAVFMGFHVDHDGLGKPAFSRLARRGLSDYVGSNPELRIPIGIGYAVPMGYHEGAD